MILNDQGGSGSLDSFDITFIPFGTFKGSIFHKQETGLRAVIEIEEIFMQNQVQKNPTMLLQKKNSLHSAGITYSSNVWVGKSWAIRQNVLSPIKGRRHGRAYLAFILGFDIIGLNYFWRTTLCILFPKLFWPILRKKLFYFWNRMLF